MKQLAWLTNYLSFKSGDKPTEKTPQALALTGFVNLNNA